MSQLAKLRELAEKYDKEVHNQQNSFFGDYEIKQQESIRQLQKSLWDLILCLEKNSGKMKPEDIENFAKETIKFLTPFDKNKKEVSFKDREVAYKNFLNKNARVVAAKTAIQICYVLLAAVGAVITLGLAAVAGFMLYQEAMYRAGVIDKQEVTNKDGEKGYMYIDTKSAQKNVLQAGTLFAKDTVNAKHGNNHAAVHKSGKKT